MEHIGQVLLVESTNGPRTLCVVVGVMEDQPPLPPARWLNLLSDGECHWVQEELIVDRAPSCPTCGQQSRWWWSPQGEIFCQICRPPQPAPADWSKVWQHLGDLLNQLSHDDPWTPVALKALEDCDVAWLAKDWGRFQRHVLEIQWVIECSGIPSDE